MTAPIEGGGSAMVVRTDGEQQANAEGRTVSSVDVDRILISPRLAWT